MEQNLRIIEGNTEIKLNFLPKSENLTGLRSVPSAVNQEQ